MVTTQKASKRSPLLVLPAELRNRIYGLAFDDTVLIRQGSKEPGLLRCCQQVRKEATGTYYSKRTFETSEHVLKPWLKQIGDESKAMLKDVHFYHHIMEHNTSVLYDVNKSTNLLAYDVKFCKEHYQDALSPGVLKVNLREEGRVTWISFESWELVLGDVVRGDVV